jgi:hypothetical protein
MTSKERVVCILYSDVVPVSAVWKDRENVDRYYLARIVPDEVYEQYIQAQNEKERAKILKEYEKSLQRRRREKRG